MVILLVIIMIGQEDLGSRTDSLGSDDISTSEIDLYKSAGIYKGCQSCYCWQQGEVHLTPNNKA